MPDDTSRPLKTPEPPDQDAVNERRHEAEGPFGADMTTLLGGTRALGENAPAPAQGTSLGTGTDASSGESLSTTDTRARHDGDSRDERG